MSTNQAPSPPSNPSWIEEVKQAYEEGASDIEVCRVMNFTLEEFNQLYETNPKFRKFIDLGRMMSKAWWYTQGRKHLQNKGFNTSLWSFNMKNKFGWAEKQENYGQNEIPEANLSTEELKTKVNSLLKQMAKQEGKTDAQILLDMPSASRN